MPDIVACIVVLFGRVALGPFSRKTWSCKYFWCCFLMYVFDAPESAFKTSEQVEVTTLDDKLFSKHLTKLFFILLTCVAPRKNHRQLALLPFIRFLKVASNVCLFFLSVHYLLQCGQHPHDQQ